MGRVIQTINRMFGIGGTGSDDIALIEERLALLQPRMPWLYLMMLSCLVGMIFSFDVQRDMPWFAVIILVGICFRGLSWIRLRRTAFRGEAARNMLRTIGIASFVGSIAVGTLIVQILPMVGRDHWQLLMVMASTCTVALAVPMGPLPGLARASHLAFGVPAATFGMFCGPERAASVASFNLLLCNLILIYLTQIQDRSFIQQFTLRRSGEQERVRAERAERTAITERTQAKAAAESDFLTGLPNRRAFLTAIGKRRSRGTADTLMILDLDGFKPVNDTFGHAIGDELLKQVAQRLFGLARGDTLVARLGGDEFAVLARGVEGEAARRFAGKVVDELSRPYTIGPSTIGVAACLGMAMLDPGSVDPAEAIREADLALYRAKAAGRGKIEHYDRGLGEAVKRRSAIELALREPGVEHEIELAFQPIYDLETMRISSFEALARWSHSTLGPVSPADFIPITEQIQLVERLSCALLSRAIGNAACWPGEQRLSFNLSAVQLCSIGSALQILEIVSAQDYAPERLQIEVTETAMMGDLAAARSNIEQLRAAGVQVVLDDFGAGFASIGYLREMQFDALKLDGSLLSACETSQGTALLKGVISLARAIGTPCIAEHVETMQQAILLRILGCRFGQGYWLGKPVAATEAETLSRAEMLQGPTLRLVG